MVKFVYVPVLKTLQSMFKNKEVVQVVQQASKYTEDIYEDICDGEYIKTHSQDKHALQLQLYYDDFETTNHLGSKKGIHKLGCIYFILRILPPKCNSVLMNIHIISLFNSEDFKKYGFDAVLQPLVDDLMILDTQIIHTALYDTQVTGYNLALDGLFGFVESFSATLLQLILHNCEK